MGFEIFCGKRTMLELRHGEIRSDILYITNKGRFQFNKFASRKIKKNRIFCILKYDEEKKSIGVCPMTSKNINTYRAHWDKGGRWCFSAISFLHYIGVKNMSLSMSLSAEWDEQQKMFIIQIPKKLEAENGQE